VNFYYIDNETISISVNETILSSDINQVIAIFCRSIRKEAFEISDYVPENIYPMSLNRESEF
jgi:glycine dehydrogenase